MTYNNLIDIVKSRGMKFLKDSIYYDNGAIYETVNSAMIALANEFKILQSETTLSTVVGQQDYTISTAIATDCDKILSIYFNHYPIPIKYISIFEKDVYWESANFDNTINTNVSTTQIEARVFNGTLRLYPTPSTVYSLDVFYSKLIPQGNYTRATGTVSIPFQDIYIEPIVYGSLKILSESFGDLKMAEYYDMQCRTKAEEAFARRAVYDGDSEIQYHDGVE